MNRRTRFGLMSVTGMVLCLVALPAHATDYLLHARVSFESGGALVRGGDDADWSYATINSLILPGDDLWIDREGLAEMEFSGGTFLRAADQSRARIVSMPPQILVEGTTGSFYVHRISRSSGNFLFRTPAADVVIDRDAQVRVDIVGQGSTTVTVRWGEARILTSGGTPVTVRAGERVFVDPGLMPSTPAAFNRNEMDAFDAWSAEQARTLAVGTSTIPQSVSITPATIGHRELATQGTWVYVDNTPYWRPTVVDYVPYRHGHWSFSSAYGYSWVGNYSFCYVTSHYGRWRHHPSYGWIWTYRDTWAPAWVFSARYGPNYVWAPLDPWDRPVSYGSAFFTVGGHRISVFASSYAPVSGLYYGPTAVHPVTQGTVTNIVADQVNIWNIYAGGSHYTRSPRYSRGHLDRFAGRDLPVRDYNPRRTIRGPEVNTRTNLTARTVSDRLEQTSRVASIDQGRAAPVRSVRTPSATASRTAQVRQAAISTDRSVRVTPSTESPRRSTVDARGGQPDAARGLRAPSAGDRPAGSRVATPESTRTTTPTRSAPATRETIAPDRSRVAPSPAPSTRTTRSVGSLSTTPSARPDAYDPSRGVRGSDPSAVRSTPLPQSRQPSQQVTSPRSTAPAQQPRVTTPPQSRQPSQQVTSPRSTAPAQQPRVTTPPQSRQPSQVTTPRSTAPAQQPRISTPPQSRQPSQVTSPRSTGPLQQPRISTPPTQQRVSPPPAPSRAPVAAPSQPRVSSPPVQQRSVTPPPAAPSTPRFQSPPNRVQAPAPAAPTTRSAPSQPSSRFAPSAPAQRSAPSGPPANRSGVGSRGASERGR